MGKDKTHGMSKFWKNSHEFSVQEMLLKWGEGGVEMFETYFQVLIFFEGGYLNHRDFTRLKVLHKYCEN